VYEVGTDPYCYPGTTILRNLLDLRDADALEGFEADAVTQRSDEPLPEGDFAPSHLQDIHRHLFQDVYEWAGEYRKVRITKGDSAFCYPEHIEGQITLLFEELRDLNFLRGVELDVFARQGAHFLSELNAIHPFREGNGRTQMIFFGLLAAEAGHPFDLGRLESEAFLRAMISAFKGDEEPLALEIRRMIS
jgi:cell filamentation protein